MGGSKSKRPLPSYEEGELRDPSIKKMQDKAYQRGADGRDGADGHRLVPFDTRPAQASASQVSPPGPFV